MTSVILGGGEVGTSLFNVLHTLSEDDTLLIFDKGHTKPKGIRTRYLHICFPFSKKFIDAVVDYAKEYTPRDLIIHSTVPVGTTRKIADRVLDITNVYHSPVRGVHPNLVEGLKTFPKFLSGPKPDFNSKDTKDTIFNYLQDRGMKPYYVGDSYETSELAKLMSTTYYAWNILFEKEMHTICEELGVNYKDAYTAWNTQYNEGYKRLKMEHVVRPVLTHVPGDIGGHCLIPNTKLLKHRSMKFIRETILKQNKKYGLFHNK